MLSHLDQWPVVESGPPNGVFVARDFQIRDNDTVYHEGIVSSIIKKLGYTPHPMNEAHAIVYSELAEHDFTGIGVIDEGVEISPARAAAGDLVIINGDHDGEKHEGSDEW